jgi:hypothetical protein
LFQQYIITAISESILTQTVSHSELALALCWVVGEYTSVVVNPSITANVISDYHEALELFAYERMTSVKLIKSGLAQVAPIPLMTPVSPLISLLPVLANPLTSSIENKVQTFNTRIMLIVLSSLAKLATRCQDLTSRVVICLLKVCSCPIIHFLHVIKGTAFTQPCKRGVTDFTSARPYKINI